MTVNTSFSDYVVYVDESGDGNLEKPNPSYPMLVLAFCVFKKELFVGKWDIPLVVNKAIDEKDSVAT